MVRDVEYAQPLLEEGTSSGRNLKRFGMVMGGLALVTAGAVFVRGGFSRKETFGSDGVAMTQDGSRGVWDESDIRGTWEVPVQPWGEEKHSVPSASRGSWVPTPQPTWVRTPKPTEWVPSPQNDHNPHKDSAGEKKHWEVEEPKKHWEEKEKEEPRSDGRDDEAYQIIKYMGKKWSDYFNTGRFDDLAALYTDDALVVPSPADHFVARAQIGAFFSYVSATFSKRIDLRPVAVEREDENTIHEVGLAQQLGTHYYVRWVKKMVNRQPIWMLDFDMMVVNSKKPLPKSRPMSKDQILRDPAAKIVYGLTRRFSQTFNNKQFRALQNDMYHPFARVVPPASADGKQQFVSFEYVAKLFRAAYDAGMTHLDIAPKAVYQQGDVIHEIGVDPSGMTYYVRWVRKYGQWKIGFDIFSVGSA